ncbi:MAG TPA: DUF6638 family protein [Candidatus Paceibacterota bacterium]
MKYSLSLHAIAGAKLRRYNAALRLLELKPFCAREIHVDAAGWSPEVAEALGDEDYLIVAGKFHAIVVAPEQASLPVIRPAHTFDGLVLADLYRRAAPQVANLTERAALVVRIAPKIDALKSARDLEHVQDVETVVRDTGGLMEAGRLQREGAEAIRAERDEACFDDDLRRRLVESAERYGDLRQELLEIPELHWNDARCFGTRLVDGGALVFRDLPRGKSLVAVRNVEPGQKQTRHYLALDRGGGPEAVFRLIDAKLLVVPHGDYRRKPARIDYLRACLLADCARKEQSNAKLVGLTEIGRDRLVKKLDGALPSQYWDLERYRAMLGEKRGVRELDAFVEKEGLAPLLALPAEDVTPGTAAALQCLLAAIEPRDVLRCRCYDPVGYHAVTDSWPEAYHEWAKDRIKKQISAAG